MGDRDSEGSGAAGRRPPRRTDDRRDPKRPPTAGRTTPTELPPPIHPDQDVVYGRNPVLEALRAGEALTEVFIAEGANPRGPLADLLQAARQAGVPVRWAPRPVLDRMVAGHGQGSHQGVVAQTAGYRYADLASILAVAIRRGEEPFLLVLDAVQDVHNLGSLIRTAEAAGMHGVLLPDRRAAGVTAAVRKASAGAVAHLPVARVHLPEALDALRERQVRVVGLAMEGPVDYATADLSGAVAIVVGGEGQGLEAAVVRRCDQLVRLPMHGHVASLNAAVAGSIVVYEALRQRGTSGTPRLVLP